MIFRKTIATVLCFILCLTLVSCVGSLSGDGPILNINKNTGDINFAGAYEKYSPADIMLTSSGGQFTVSWDLMYYFICLAIEEIYETTGTYPDLGDTSGTGFRDQIMTRAAESALVCLAIESAAAKAGAEITDEDRASIALNQELAEAQEGGAAAFEEYLAANHATYDVYLYLVGIDCLYENTIAATYGDGAKLFSDEATATFIEDEEYFTVKQIFFSATGAGDKALSDSEKLAKRDQAESLYSQLAAYAGDIDELFDELMFAHSEDTTALNMYPDGYLFRSGETYPALEEAARSLDIGDISAVLETELGYHIIYRLPVNYDIVPQGYVWDARNTLRSQAARDSFGQYVEDLRIELAETADGDFYDLDFAELFK